MQSSLSKFSILIRIARPLPLWLPEEVNHQSTSLSQGMQLVCPAAGVTLDAGCLAQCGNSGTLAGLNPPWGPDPCEVRYEQCIWRMQFPVSEERGVGQEEGGPVEASGKFTIWGCGTGLCLGEK